MNINLKAVNTRENKPEKLSVAEFGTLLGDMVAVGNNQALYYLQFANKQDLEDDIKLFEKTDIVVVQESAHSITSIQKELQAYFAGTLTTFKTPLCFLGTTFQEATWQALTHIPYGQTLNYKQLAVVVGNPKACRAVANANGANPLVIVVPCHRVIASSGGLGGYTAGTERKQWLLKHEGIMVRT